MAKKPIPQKERKRSTRAEKAERIEMCRRLLAQGKRKSDIKKAVAAHYGCTESGVETNYLYRARELMLLDLQRPVVEHRVDSYEFYREILADKQASLRDKLKACERIDKLLGLETQESQVNVNVSGDATITVDDRATAARNAIAGELAKRSVPGPTGNGDGRAATNGDGSA